MKNPFRNLGKGLQIKTGSLTSAKSVAEKFVYKVIMITKKPLEKMLKTTSIKYNNILMIINLTDALFAEKKISPV